MPVIDRRELKRILHAIDQPGDLDDHPWTKCHFVAIYRRNNPNPAGQSAGQELLLALVAEFQRAQPAGRSDGRGRLHTRWLQYGILAARYFAPILDARPAPPSLADAWSQIHPALHAVAPDGGSIVDQEEQAPPLSTLSDWHTRGLNQFVQTLAAREKSLAAQAGARNPGRSNSAHRRSLWLIAAATLLVLLAGLAWKASRLVDALAAVRQQAATVVALSQTEPGPEEIQMLEAALPLLQADLNRLEDEVRPGLPLAKYLHWVPTYGPTLATAAPLLEYSQHLLNSAQAALEGGRPLLQAYLGEAEGLSVKDLMTLMLSGDSHFERSQAELELALAARAQFTAAGLTPEVAGMVARMDRAQILLADSLVLARALPQLLGAEPFGPQTYLVLLQNEDELRATGGFITGLGLVTIQNGEVLSFSFEDSPAVDNPDLPYNRLPWQMVDYMDGGVWLMRDANWSPDFPTVARFAETLYAYARVHAVDGVMAVDQAAIAQLLVVLGPVEAGGISVTADNVIAVIREQKYVYRDPDGSTERKEFLGVLGAAMLEKIQQDSHAPWVGLARTLVALVREKHILVQVDSQEVTALLARRNLDGALRPPASGDFLMVVESNLGFNKVNAAVERQLAYSVDLRDPAVPTAELRVAVTNTNTRAIGCRQIQPLEGTGYAPLIAQCYWNYLRVFTAPGTELLNFAAQPIPGQWLLSGIPVAPRVDRLTGLDGGAGFGTLMVVPTNRTIETVFYFDLPDDLLVEAEGDWTYALRIQKQSGTNGTPLLLTIVLPPGATGVSASPQLMDGGAGSWRADLRLDTDQDLWITFATE